MLSVLSIIHYYLLKNYMYRKRTECAGDDAGPSKGKKKKTAKKKTPKNKKTFEEEAKEGCSCSSSKGCQEPEGPVF